MHPIHALDRARAAVRIAQSCRSRALRARHAAAAREAVDVACAVGADVSGIVDMLEAIEHELAQGDLFEQGGGR
ncbi:MAG: hypothetical protein HYV09_15225 [Deltaproteobacteria bacterium]|nr:hypothetical protein [Deltaproteobacteria bacterium]